VLSDLQVSEQVLQRRLVTRGVCTVLQVLVQWSGLPPSLATWEDCEALSLRFPRAPARRHAVAYRGDVRDRQPLVGNVEDRVSGPGAMRHEPSKRKRRPNPSVIGPQWFNG
jgi:hypothetical protein